ncbi:MAG: HTTM domain-containing protein [Bdellovibrionales bacterium]|nr:HTTM domain-containing protein [Bdellovibrionales bacterium]
MIQLTSLRFSEKQVPSDSFHFFRVWTCLLVVYEVLTHFYHDFIKTLYIDPAILFPYLSWLKPLSLGGMNAVFILIALSAAAVAMQKFYRISTWVLVALFGYIIFLDKVLYLNHMYLLWLILILFALMPKVGSKIQEGWLQVFKLLLGIVYFYAAVAKLNPDWVFRSEPMYSWLSDRDDLPLIGWLFAEKFVAILFSFSGILIDFFLIPALWTKKYRAPAFIVGVAFHSFNALYFDIGIFPFLMIAAMTLFFDPDWCPGWMKGLWKKHFHTLGANVKGPGKVIWVFFAFQILFPLRGYFYPGVALWTQDGHAFSWRMMLRSVEGRLAFSIVDPKTGQQWLEQPRERFRGLALREVCTNPEIILQYAHFIRDRYAEKGIAGVKVFAISGLNLNSNGDKTYVNPEVDLTQVKASDFYVNWLMPYPY